MISLVKNGVGRDIPEYIEGIGHLKPYEKPFSVVPEGIKAGSKLKRPLPHKSKLIKNIEEAEKRVRNYAAPIDAKRLETEII